MTAVMAKHVELPADLVEVLERLFDADEDTTIIDTMRRIAEDREEDLMELSDAVRRDLLVAREQFARGEVYALDEVERRLEG